MDIENLDSLVIGAEVSSHASCYKYERKPIAATSHRQMRQQYGGTFIEDTEVAQQWPARTPGHGQAVKVARSELTVTAGNVQCPQLKLD